MTFQNYNSRRGVYGIQSKSSILTHALRRYYLELMNGLDPKIFYL